MAARRSVEDAEAVLRQIVERRCLGSTLSAELARESFEEYAHAEFNVPDTPDSDGLLFQYGIYDFTGRDLFTLSLVRQFERLDQAGDHASYFQICIELTYEVSDDLSNLGRREWWFFRGGDDPTIDVNSWLLRVREDRVWTCTRSVAPVSSGVVPDEVLWALRENYMCN